MPVQRFCKTCSLHKPARKVNFHAAALNGEVVYRCEECLSYLDKDDILFHMNTHAYNRLPTQMKTGYYRREKAVLEEQAGIDEQAKIELDKLNDYFRVKEEEETKKQERAGEMKSEPTTDDPQPGGSGTNAEPTNPDLQPIKKKVNKRTSVESRREQESDGERSPPKRKRVEPKRSSDAEPRSPVKRQKKKRVFIAKNTPREKDLPDRARLKGDEDEEGEDPETSPEIEAKAGNSKESPKASRTCPICGKKYRASSSYFYHMKYFHKRSREHECNVCNKKFGTKAGLTHHVSIHTGAFDLACKECGKRFKSKPSLYIHEQSHSGPKRWACSQCSRSFRWRTHLARHVTRHAAERAHVCSVCGRGFSVRCDLLRHARTHAAAEYHCATCGLKFSQKRYLQAHVVKKHPEAPSVVTRS